MQNSKSNNFNYKFIKILKCQYLERIYWNEANKIPHKYIFFYRSMRSCTQNLTIKFVNSIWENKRLLHIAKLKKTSIRLLINED